MRATVFHAAKDIRVEEVPRPHVGVGEAVIRITLTTICGTDLHIVRGEYPVRPGLVIGHEPVGVIEELGRRCYRLQNWRQSVSRRDYTLWTMPCLFVRPARPMRTWPWF